jgi:hypothetical protein
MYGPVQVLPRAVDCMAVSAVQAGVTRVETTLEVDDVSAGMRCRPGQVALVIVTELVDAQVPALNVVAGTGVSGTVGPAASL